MRSNPKGTHSEDKVAKEIDVNDNIYPVQDCQPRGETQPSDNQRWFNAKRCLEALWVPADEEADSGSSEHQPSVQLDCATHSAINRRACSTPFISTPLHTATYPISLNHREDIQMFKPETLLQRTPSCTSPLATPDHQSGRSYVLDLQR